MIRPMIAGDASDYLTVRAHGNSGGCDPQDGSCERFRPGAGVGRLRPGRSLSQAGVAIQLHSFLCRPSRSVLRPGYAVRHGYRRHDRWMKGPFCAPFLSRVLGTLCPGTLLAFRCGARMVHTRRICKPYRMMTRMRSNNALDSDTVRAPLRAPYGARQRER